MRYVIIVIVAVLLSIGCSASDNSPNTPSAKVHDNSASQSTHTLWGLWQCTANPVSQTLDIVELRQGDFHLNVLPFLEPPALVNLTLESLQFNGNTIEADIGLRHPFTGLTEFTGFDVCGIFISSGSITGFSDSTLRFAGSGDTRLKNPDGLTRWWNPVEFPVNDGSMFAYKDGLLGTPDAQANFSSTLNAYKYYCDDITNPGDPLSVVNLSNRGLFSPGTKNVRHYSIDLAGGLIFNYAVDASWKPPTGGPPYTAPDDFDPEANRPEAWRADVVELSNTLWNDGPSSGGGITLQVNVYDWFNAEQNIVSAESPGSFAPTGPVPQSGGGVGYSTYTIDIENATPQTQGSIDILIISQSEVSGYGGLLPGKAVSAYFLYTASVANATSDIVCDLQVVTPMPYSGWGGLIEFDASGSYDPSGGLLTYEWDFNDDGIFGDSYDDGTDAMPKRCFMSNYTGDVCVQVSVGADMQECCIPVTINILPSKNLTLRNVEAYDIAIRPSDGALMVLYTDGKIWQYDIADAFQPGTDTLFGDINDEWYQDGAGMDFIEIAPNGVVIITGTDNFGLNRTVYYMADGTAGNWAHFHASSATLFDAFAFGTEDVHASNCGSASGRSWAGITYSELEWNDPPEYGTTHWFSYWFTDTGDYSGINKVYQPYSVSVQTDRDGDWVWWLESASTEYYCSRWHCVNGGNPTYSSLVYDNAWFGTGAQSDVDASWNNAQDLARDANNRYYVLDKLSDNTPRVKVFDVTSNPGASVGGFGDTSSIDGDPRRIEGTDYADYIVVLHGASIPQKISVFTGCEIP